jgi:hypothetical protein
LLDLAAAFGSTSRPARRAVKLDEVLDGSVAGYQEDIDRHYGLVQGEREGTTLARGDHGRVST